MKKIAFIINDLRVGGAERALTNLTMGLPKDWEIDIILSDAREIAYSYRGNIIELGIYRERYRSSTHYFAKVLWKRCRVLRKLKKQRRYDACIGFADSASMANILSGKRYCPVITAVRSTLSEANRLKEYKYIVSPLVKLLYNRSDRIVAVSEGVANDLIEHYGIHSDKIMTIYNGTDLAQIDGKSKEALEDEEEKMISGSFCMVNMGRLDIPKAQWHLIRAFGEAVKEVPDAKLLIIGEGGQRQYLETLIDDMELVGKVFLTGSKSNPFRILSRCDLFVFPSLYEGFPNAMVEAMYCGLPVIATDFRTGARELLALKDSGQSAMCGEMELKEYGVLLPVCDGVQYQAKDELTEEEKLLAKAMIMLAKDHELRGEYAKKAKERGAEFGLDHMCGNWRKFIESLGDKYGDR